ncbi:unnamed protein product [Chrysoparadoxa australica]
MAAAGSPLLIRVLMVGDSSVGKTSIVLRYDKRGYNPKFSTTIGVDYSDRMVDLDGKTVKLQIWDTAGQERFHSLTTSFFKRAEGFVLVYDVCSRASFESLDRWMKDAKDQGKKDCDIVICGNKCDVRAGSRSVQESEGKEFASQHMVPYFETSAKDNINIDEVFYLLARSIMTRLDRERSEGEANESSPTVKIGEGAENSKSGCCNV